jgi:hypothetical protein
MAELKTQQTDASVANRLEDVDVPTLKKLIEKSITVAKKHSASV